jgi:hypothetical protein
MCKCFGRRSRCAFDAMSMESDHLMRMRTLLQISSLLVLRASSAPPVMCAICASCTNAINSRVTVFKLPSLCASCVQSCYVLLPWCVYFTSAGHDVPYVSAAGHDAHPRCPLSRSVLGLTSAGTLATKAEHSVRSSSGSNRISRHQQPC